MKNPFYVICTSILAAFILITAGIFIGRNVHNNAVFLTDQAASSQPDTDGLIDINTASADQLQLIAKREKLRAKDLFIANIPIFFLNQDN